MKRVSNASHLPPSIGQNVTVLIPKVDRGKGNFRSIIAVITRISRSEDEIYKLGTKDGVLMKLYSRSEFDACKHLFFDLVNLPENKEISLRSAAALSSVGIGQGFVRCHCTKH